MNLSSSTKFQKLILDWYDVHGRKQLPWQQNKTPYRVWISEVMLQQTQVATVIPYFERFMQHFPTIQKLAQADLDAVMHLWAGLGYYSRARNIHRAAQMVVQHFKGNFPDTLNDLLSLPGVGRSTAGAILAIAFNQQATILDGNVKRVLSRYASIQAPLKEKKVEDTLWAIAETFSPKKRIADYTQAMMDLGATICVRGKPLCNQCPLQKSCMAYEEGVAELLPIKSIGKSIPAKQATFLILQKNQDVLLQKRPPSGIWGGLWSLPEIVGIADEKQIQHECFKTYRLQVEQVNALPSFRHTFSHFHLDIYPVVVNIQRKPRSVTENNERQWYNLHQPSKMGLPRPIQQILKNLVK